MQRVPRGRRSRLGGTQPRERREAPRALRARSQSPVRSPSHSTRAGLGVPADVPGSAHIQDRWRLR